MISRIAARARCSTGFPRTIAQAEALDRLLAKRGRKIDLVLELKVDDAALFERVKSRIAAGRYAPGRRQPENPEKPAERLL